MAAALWAGEGALLSHATAAGIWLMLPRPHPAADVDVSAVGRWRRRGTGVRVHRLRSLEGAGTTHLGLPVTTPPRTLLDLAAEATPRRLEQALAVAIRTGLVTRVEVEALVDATPRRWGAARLKRLLEPGRGPAFTRSEAEERFLDLVRRAELPEPETNVVVGGMEVDFLWRTERLAVEVDGWEFHGTRRAFEGDRRRDAALLGVGFRSMRLTWDRLVRQPEAALRDLIRALAAAPP